MQAFTELTGIAAALPLSNVDTDKIIPARFMKTIQRAGLGRDLFHALRYENGKENPDFVLNQEPYRGSQILIAFRNFGCGSSREHAPWALLDFGIRCIIAPSFADIFHANCFKNGILPVVLPRADCEVLMEDARDPDRRTLTIDLHQQVVRRADGQCLRFEVDAFRKELLLKGLDDISLTLEHTSQIDAFESQRVTDAWLDPAPDRVRAA
jgi:3-isopropylmalate/(R)-2-methylmalate dehydratase small subunit